MDRNGWTAQVDVVRASHGEIKKSVVSRWLDPTVTDKPSPENCHKAAQVFKTTVLEAFVAAGHMTNEQAGIKPATEKRSLRQLLIEAQLAARNLEEENEALRRSKQPAAS